MWRQKEGIHVQAWTDREGSVVEASSFQESPHMKVVRLSALRTRLLYPPDNIPGTNFCYRLSHP